MKINILLKAAGIIGLAVYIIVTGVIIAIPNEPKETATCQRDLAGDYMRFHIIKSKLGLSEETQVFGWPGRNAYYWENGRRRAFNLAAKGRAE